MLRNTFDVAGKGLMVIKCISGDTFTSSSSPPIGDQPWIASLTDSIVEGCDGEEDVSETDALVRLLARGLTRFDMPTEWQYNSESVNGKSDRCTDTFSGFHGKSNLDHVINPVSSNCGARSFCWYAKLVPSVVSGD